MRRYVGTSLVGSKPYRYFFSEKHHSLPVCRRASTYAIALWRGGWFFKTQNASEQRLSGGLGPNQLGDGGRLI